MKREYGKKPYNEKWTWKNGLKTLNYYFKIGEGYVALIDDKIVGFIIAIKEYYNEGAGFVIEELAIDSNYQKQGIGKKLMEKMESKAKNAKAKYIYLTTSKNAPAFKFYKKMGYIPSKKTVYFRKELR